MTSLSADGRIPLWKVSWRDFKHAPLLGEGAGTFWESWARYRSVPSASKQPHSLYLGVMGELGIVGLGLLILALAPSLVAAWRARARELVPFALAAYVAWGAHAAIDWDWALLGVTIPALLCGVALLKSDSGKARRLRRPVRAAALVVAPALILAALPVLLADLQIQAAQAQASSSEPESALAKARRAHRLEPWSSEPYLVMFQAYRTEGYDTRERLALERALSRDSSNWNLWQLLTISGTPRERAEARRKVATLNPISSVG